MAIAPRTSATALPSLAFGIPSWCVLPFVFGGIAWLAWLVN